MTFRSAHKNQIGVCPFEWNMLSFSWYQPCYLSGYPKWPEKTKLHVFIALSALVSSRFLIKAMHIAGDIAQFIGKNLNQNLLQEALRVRVPDWVHCHQRSKH